MGGLIKFQEWLEKCPVNYDEHYETSDDNITTINFHYKNIWNRNSEVLGAKRKGKIAPKRLSLRR